MLRASSRLLPRPSRIQGLRCIQTLPTTEHCIPIPTGPIRLYDFQRFNTSYNDGRHIRWPLDELEVTPYFRQEMDEIDDNQILASQLAQNRVPLKEAAHFLPNFYLTDDLCERELSAYYGKTLHSDSILIGIYNNPENNKLERYILKFFPNTPKALANARREVLFSYLLVESGEAGHAPKISLQYLNGVPYVLRRFYRGYDGRSLLNGAMLPQVSNEGLVKDYALRYVLFGDLDFHNPGNIIFTRHSQLTPKTIVHIDGGTNLTIFLASPGEYILPDPMQISHCHINDSWDPSQPIPGSTRWRQEKTRELGADQFFELMIESENPILSFLKLKCTLAELKDLVLPYYTIENCLQGWVYYEQLARSFEVLPMDVLERREADFQIILRHWHRHTELLKPITLKQLITGCYHA